MKRRTISNIILLLLVLSYIFIYRTIVMTDYLKDSEFITASVMTGISFISFFLLGFRKNKSDPLKKNIRFTIFSSLIIYFSVTYLVGFIIGFLKNSYSLEFFTMINNLFPPLVIMTAVEFIRYITVSSNKDKKWMIALITVILTLFDLSINIKTLPFNDLGLLFEKVTLIILPIISKNVMLSYITYYDGVKSTLLYSLVMGLYIYMVPIVPDLGDFINSIVGITFPILIYVKCSKLVVDYYEGAEIHIGKKGFGLTDGLAFASIAIVLGLMSGMFPYYVMGIGSASMSPLIKKGDLVFIEKVDSEDDIKEGDILVFQHNGRTTVHRYVRTELIEGKKVYRTQGDANNTEDNVELTIEDVEGKVHFHIPYIAYPTIFLTEALEK